MGEEGWVKETVLNKYRKQKEHSEDLTLTMGRYSTDTV